MDRALGAIALARRWSPTAPREPLVQVRQVGPGNRTPDCPVARRYQEGAALTFQWSRGDLNPCYLSARQACYQAITTTPSATSRGVPASPPSSDGPAAAQEERVEGVFHLRAPSSVPQRGVEPRSSDFQSDARTT